MKTTVSWTLRRAVLGTLPLWMCAIAFADVTLRYQSSVKVAPTAPPQVKQQLEKSQAILGNSILRMKNGKCWSQTGPWNTIIDFAGEQMTLIDSERHTLAKLPVADLPDRVAALMPKPPAMPEAAQRALSAMKTTADSKLTGRTASILGIQSEERQFTLSMEMPLPPGAPQASMTMKMVMEIWSAKPEEALHNQAIRELMGYKLWTNYFMNPARAMEKIVASMPGREDFMKKMTDGLFANNGVIMRTRVAIYVPIPNADPDSPLFEMTNEAAEVSSDAVDAAAFQIPADYQTVDAVELLKSVIHRQMDAMGVPEVPKQ